MLHKPPRCRAANHNLDAAYWPQNGPAAMPDLNLQIAPKRTSPWSMRRCVEFVRRMEAVEVEMRKLTDIDARPLRACSP
jgi:hypothetical protein